MSKILPILLMIPALIIIAMFLLAFFTVRDFRNGVLAFVVFILALLSPLLFIMGIAELLK